MSRRAESGMTNGLTKSTTMAAIGELFLSALLLLSAISLPWATYQTNSHTTNFTSGRFGLILTACSIIAFGLAATYLSWHRYSILWIQLSVSCIAFVSSIVLALTKISDANRTASASVNSHTSYGIGSGFGLATSTLLVALSIASLVPRKINDR